MMRSILVGILVLMAAGVGFLTFDWYRRSAWRRALRRALHAGRPEGRADHRSGVSRPPSAVFFGFTHCPEVCPTTLFELDGWLKKLGDEGKNIRAYFVIGRSGARHARGHEHLCQQCVGPHHRHHRRAGQGRRDGQGLRHLFARRSTLEGGDYTMDHTASVLLLDSGGDFAGTIAYGENAGHRARQAEAAGRRRLMTKPHARPDPASTSRHRQCGRGPRFSPRSKRPSRKTACRSPCSNSTRTQGIHEVSLYADATMPTRSSAACARSSARASASTLAIEREVAARHRLGGAFAGRAEAGARRPLLRAWRA